MTKWQSDDYMKNNGIAPDKVQSMEEKRMKRNEMEQEQFGPELRIFSFCHLILCLRLCASLKPRPSPTFSIFCCLKPSDRLAVCSFPYLVLFCFRVVSVSPIKSTHISCFIDFLFFYFSAGVAMLLSDWLFVCIVLSNHSSEFA